MKKIDINTWDRKEIYQFFSGVSHPFYMVSFKVDVTALKAYAKWHQCSFYYALIYLCTKTMAKIDNFQYVCEGEDVYLTSERVPSFTDRKANSELFHIVTLPIEGTMLDYCKKAKEVSLTQQSFIDMSQEGGHLAYFSCLPTLRLTALTNEFDILQDGFAKDSVPRIAWGKYEDNHGRLELTMSLEVNHRFIDGIHIEKFATYLQEAINHLEVAK